MIFSPKLEVLPVVGPEAAERKHAPEAAAAEQHEQRRAERPPGNGVAEKDDDAADEIEPRAVADRLEHAERNADQVAEEEPGEAEEDRDRKARLDDVPDRILVDVRVARDRGAATFQSHMHVADVDRLVEPVEAPDLLERFRRNLGARARPAPPPAPALAGDRHLVAHDLALDRPARHEVHDDEDGQRDADERRDDQQEPPEEVPGHRVPGVVRSPRPCANSSQYRSSVWPDRQLDRRVAHAPRQSLLALSGIDPPERRDVAVVADRVSGCPAAGRTCSSRRMRS